MSPLRMSLFAALVIASLSNLVVVDASGGSNENSSPAAAPQSSVGTNIALNTLQAGAGGTYTPLGGTQFAPARQDPTNPVDVPPPPDPQGKVCPTGTIFHTRQGISSVMHIYPALTRNAQGGYDASDPYFGYAQPNAVPAGGSTTQTAIGSPATAATVPGHVISVDAGLDHWGTWQDATPGVAPYGGSCVGAAWGFSAPYIAGDAPPPAPPLSVLEAPPFQLGQALMAQVTGTWRIGRVDTLPGPQPTATTYVHIPTCAWLDTGAPSAPVLLHAVTTMQEDGVTLFLLYDISVTPGPITWSWGDGEQTQSGPLVSAPTTLPTYNPTAQTWTDPCTVSHAYATVSDARTITASETFTVAVTVSWSDGVSVHTQPIACDRQSGGPCQLTLGPADGWTSGPHAVSQIEPVPYLPQTH